MKLFAIGLTSVLGIGLTTLFQPPPPPDEDGPPPKAKKKGEPKDELRKAYDLLRRVRADSGSGRAEERTKDWTDRATSLYRKAIEAKEKGDGRRSREFGVAAHDLARAIDHAHNAARFERADPELPPPPDDAGPEDLSERTYRDLNRAYDRIREAAEPEPVADAKFYVDAARDLYNAARRDVEAGRVERGGELARAAEAITHVPEHLAHAADDGPDEPRKRDDEPKKKGRPREKAGRGPHPKGERGDRGRTLPPALP